MWGLTTGIHTAPNPTPLQQYILSEQRNLFCVKYHMTIIVSFPRKRQPNGVESLHRPAHPLTVTVLRKMMGQLLQKTLRIILFVSDPFLIIL